MGRPRKQIDADQVEKLSVLGCTVQDIADFFGCGRELIHERFSDSLKRGRAREKMSIRRARMIRAINDKSDAMLIFLSKIRLGENDNKMQQGTLNEPEPTDANGNSIDP